MGSTLKCVYCPQQDFMAKEETGFSLGSSCQLEIASWLVMGVHVPFPVLALGPSMTCPCAGPVHAATIFERLYVHQSCCV